MSNEDSTITKDQKMFCLFHCQNKFISQFLHQIYFIYVGLTNVNTFEKFQKKLFLDSVRVRREIFHGNLVPMSEYSSSQRFFKFHWGKITNMSLKG